MSFIYVSGVVQWKAVGVEQGKGVVQGKGAAWCTRWRGVPQAQERGHAEGRIAGSFGACERQECVWRLAGGGAVDTGRRMHRQRVSCRG